MGVRSQSTFTNEIIAHLERLSIPLKSLNPTTYGRYNALYYIGDSDLYDGLQSSAQAYVSFTISAYNAVEMLQLILLILSMLLSAAYLYFVLRPYLALQRDEAVKVAGLISHVPNEIDVTSHVKRVLRHAGSQAALKSNKVAAAEVDS